MSRKIPAAGPPGPRTPPAATEPAPRSYPAEPYRGGAHDVAGTTGASRVRRLSIRGFEYDPLRVYRFMFGKEPDVDEHTGFLVHS